MAVFRGSPGAPASSGLYPPRIACFVCGAEVPSDYPLYPLPPNGNGNNQVTTPYFPFLLTLEPPIGCRPPTPGGVAKSCRNCYSTLMRQWDEYEKGERIFLVDSKEIYAAKDIAKLAKELQEEFTINPIIIVTAEIRVTAINTLFNTSVTLFK